MVSALYPCLVVCLLMGAVPCAEIDNDRRKPTILSPHMEYEQWKPIGRGDPLRNDPTYDYVPPALDKVLYWLEPASPDESPRDHRKKSEVLMLGISSKRPSIMQNIRRESVEPAHKFISGPKTRYHMHATASRPSVDQRYRYPSSQQDMQTYYRNKYEMNDYKFKEYQGVPMTILVPPPLPPLASENVYQQSIFKFPEDSVTTTTQKSSESTTVFVPSLSPGLTVQEANLIYQSSSLDYGNRWNTAFNHTEITDYSGWTPTVQPSGPGQFHEGNSSSIIYPQNSDYFIDAPINNNNRPLDSNGIVNNYTDNIKYTTKSQIFVTLPTTEFNTTTPHTPLVKEIKYKDLVFDGSKLYQGTVETTTITPILEKENPLFRNTNIVQRNVMSMLGPMFELPLTSESSRDATSSFTMMTSDIQQTSAYPQSHHSMDTTIEFMQTMQPPPLQAITEQYHTQKQTNLLHILLPKENQAIPMSTHSPYMAPAPVFNINKYEPMTTTETSMEPHHLKLPKDKLSNPTYIIIEGHSKVKTYSSKNNTQVVEESPDSNEILKQEIRFQVKHLHQSKERKKSNEKTKQEKSGRNLKKLVADGVGKIDIQEANLGISYDVSNGEYIPVEIYRKGFVEAEDTDFVKSIKTKASLTEPRIKRQIGLEDIMPIDEDTIENYVYDYLKRKSKGKGISTMIASVITSDVAEVVDEIEDKVEGDR